MSRSRPTTPATPRGESDFPAHLAARSDDALVRLCLLRPDVAAPPPTSIEVLASRLRLPASTARALDGLDWPALLVLATATALGADSGPVPVGAVADRLGVDDDEAAFSHALGTLRDRALLWGEPEHVRVGAVTASAVEAAPVVVPAPGEPSGDALEAAWEALSDQARGVLGAISRGRVPAGSLGPEASGTVRAAAADLAAAGLAAVDDETVVPTAHALDRARHGARPDGASLLARPGWGMSGGATRSDRGTDAASGVAALDLLHRCDALLAALSTSPLATLKAGGVGVRELRRLARVSGVDESELPLLLEVLAAAGLLAVGDTEVGDVPYDSAWAPTEAADVWSSRDPARRWAELVLAWWSMPVAPWRVGSEVEGGGTVPALGDPVGPPAPAERGRLFRALAVVDPDAGPDPTALAEIVRWSSPVWVARAGSRPGEETAAEARRLGLVVGASPTSAARRLATGGDTGGVTGAVTGGVTGGETSAPDDVIPTVEELTAVLERALPDTVSEVIVQADLTVLAPGPLVPELAAEFALLAEVESAGAATTYRVTEVSLRRALDAGRTAAGIRDLLTRTSVTPVPQSLDYLIEDVARRHGRLRVGSAQSFVRCDDPALVAQVVSSPVAEACALRSVAPTVLVSQARPIDLVESLREHGFAPVVEDTTGAVVALTRQVARVQPGPRTRVPRVPTRLATPAELRAAITAMRSADRVRAAGSAGSGSALTGEAAVARLHEAARSGTAVMVSVVDAQGRSTARLVVPASVGGGRVDGVEPGSAEPVVLPLHRVISVSEVEPTR